MIDNTVGIWYDSEVLNGRGTRTEFEHEPVYMQGPINNRDIPCLTKEERTYQNYAGDMITSDFDRRCENYDSCSKNMTECSAFRNWAAKGDFEDTDVMRFVRAIKIEG